jgi:putative hydrolases of HD superfamily
MERLHNQFAFLLEVDKLKQVFRQSLVTDATRRENDAEHSWHLALMAIVLAEYAPPELNLSRVVWMVLVHDIVEIDAGDTYCYDAAAVCTQRERETAAADRLFSLLPLDQAKELRELWEEFEGRATPEARYAAAVDRVQPVLLNYHTRGRAWLEKGITREQVVARNRHIEAGAPKLWTYISGLIDDAVAKGYLNP